jgi:hypothetical protein
MRDEAASSASVTNEVLSRVGQPGAQASLVEADAGWQKHRGVPSTDTKDWQAAERAEANLEAPKTL